MSVMSVISNSVLSSSTGVEKAELNTSIFERKE